MVLSKERDELVRVAPFCFVVVLNHERFFRRHALRRCPVPQTQNEKGTRQKQAEHQNSPKRSTHKSSSLNPRIVACFDEKGTAPARRDNFSWRRAPGGLESRPIQERPAEVPPQSSRIPAGRIYAERYKAPPHTLPAFPACAACPRPRRCSPAKGMRPRPPGADARGSQARSESSGCNACAAGPEIDAPRPRQRPQQSRCPPQPSPAAKPPAPHLLPQSPWTQVPPRTGHRRARTAFPLQMPREHARPSSVTASCNDSLSAPHSAHLPLEATPAPPDAAACATRQSVVRQSPRQESRFSSEPQSSAGQASIAAPIAPPLATTQPPVP